MTLLLADGHENHSDESVRTCHDAAFQAPCIILPPLVFTFDELSLISTSLPDLQVRLR